MRQRLGLACLIAVARSAACASACCWSARATAASTSAPRSARTTPAAGRAERRDSARATSSSPETGHAQLRRHRRRDYKRVGDPIGNVSLTGLGDFDQLPFLSIGGGSDNGALQFVTDREATPTVRYDYDSERFGISASTNRNLNDVGVGASYRHVFEDGSIFLGVGYYDFSEFTGDVAYIGAVGVPAGHQWAASIKAAIGGLCAGIGYPSIDAGSTGELDVLTLGGGARASDPESSAAITRRSPTAARCSERRSMAGKLWRIREVRSRRNASVNFGVARTHGVDAIGAPGGAFAPEVERSTLADFGVRLTF